jgi:phosphoribosylaminoimidazolecarboxamide formyltransferase/IMP cyclohydrolase
MSSDQESQIASLTPVSSLGGSIKDNGAIAAASENGIAMAFTGIRHFKH